MGPISIGDSAYDVCYKLKTATEEVEKERNDKFAQQHKIKRIAYYTFLGAAYIALAASGTFLAFAVVELSWGHATLALISGVATWAFVKLREFFNVYTNAEEAALKQFRNPLELIKNKMSIPEAGNLSHSRHYFEGLVKPVTTEKEKKEQDAALKVAYTLFDKKIDQADLKRRIATVAVTSLVLEAIQYLALDEESKVPELAVKAEKLVDDSSLEALKNLIVAMKKPTKELKALVQRTIMSTDGKFRFRLDDLDALKG